MATISGSCGIYLALAVVEYGKRRDEYEKILRVMKRNTREEWNLFSKIRYHVSAH